MNPESILRPGGHKKTIISPPSPLAESWHALSLIAITGVAAALLTLFAARFTAVPFILWFNDANDILLLESIYIFSLALVWDGALISAGAARQLFPPSPTSASGVLGNWRRLGFFSLGPLPLVLILLTSLIVIGTSNLTLINLGLLQGHPAWRDPWLWSIEAPLFEWMSGAPLDMTLWDRIYHGAWPMEVLAIFAIVVLTRDTRRLAAFCLSFILLFYLGRFIGLINPVMGPAFFRPEHFTQLAGSVSGSAMHLLAQVMADPSAAQRSAILLGGVSAMPSLHVGMVALSAWWLYEARHWSAWLTLPWVTLVWVATILLGWHYLLDGAGGLVLAGVCSACTKRLFAAIWPAGSH